MSEALASKKRKIAIAHVIRDADECARFLEEALEALDPPIEVHRGILRVISDYMTFGKRSSSGDRHA